MYHTLLFACAVLACAWAAARASRRRARALLAALPSFPQLPVLGNLLRVLGDGEARYRLVMDMSEEIEANQKPLAFWLGPYPTIVLSDPEDVKAINNTFIEKPFFYAFGRIWLGNGLVTAPGALWKRNIKKLAGTFTGPIVDGYQDVFNAQAQKLVINLRGEVGGAPFDIIHKYLAYTTLESICQTALGVARISETIVTTEYYQAFNKTLELLIQRGLNVFLHPDCVYRLTPSYRKLVKCVAVLQNVSNTVIEKRRKEFNEIKQNGTYEEHKSVTCRPRFRSFLDILLELSESDPTMTEEQIRAEVDTIIVGGQETVANTLLYIILVIGSKPDLQEKLHAEIRAIFGDSRRPVQKADLAQMPFCEALIHETLRLYPPVPVVLRDADQECKLASCTVPAGATCVVNALGAGRARAAWGDDAREFAPERWLRAPPPPAAFLAFSYGKRACIGKRYAMALIKTLLAYCVRELEFVSDLDKLRLKVDIALKPASGHFVQVKLRQ